MIFYIHSGHFNIWSFVTDIFSIAFSLSHLKYINVILLTCPFSTTLWYSVFYSYWFRVNCFFFLIQKKRSLICDFTYFFIIDQDLFIIYIILLAHAFPLKPSVSSSPLFLLTFLPFKDTFFNYHVTYCIVSLDRTPLF